MTSDGIFPSQPSVSAKLIHYLKTNGIFIISVTYLLFRQHTAPPHLQANNLIRYAPL